VTLSLLPLDAELQPARVPAARMATAPAATSALLLRFMFIIELLESFDNLIESDWDARIICAALNWRQDQQIE
jgi:hypothetical protein